mgnify:CR=1 FL=1
MEAQDEINDFFADKAKEDQDELLDELNELTELDDLAELDGLEVGGDAVASTQKKVVQPA